MIGLWILLAHLAGLTAAASHNNIWLEDLPYRLKDRVDHQVAGHAFVPAHTLVVDEPKPDALPLSHLAVVSGFSDDGTPYTD